MKMEIQAQMASKTKIKVTDLDNKPLEDLNLSEKIFQAKENNEIIARLVNWQLANRRQGTHKVKERGEIIGSTAKIYKQKGMGRARHGSKKVVQFKGGGVVHGPTPRSHAYKLNTKLRKSAVRALLSTKLREGNIKIIVPWLIKVLIEIKIPIKKCFTETLSTFSNTK